MDLQARRGDRLGLLVEATGWRSLPWLRHGFSTRSGGVSSVYRDIRGGDKPGTSDLDLNLGWTKEDDPANVAENRLRLVETVTGSRKTALVTLRQVHSADSLIVSDTAEAASFADVAGRATREADGLITAIPGLLLGVQTADCVPVLVADTRKRAVAAFHAGWRGTAARIVEKGIARMAAEFDSRPEDLIAAVGPSIGACCYSVGEEVQATFAANFSYGKELFRTDSIGKTYLDLWEANRRQLLDAGVAAEKISLIGECSGCGGLPGRRRYFSHRCEHGFTGRMMSVIGIAEAID